MQLTINESKTIEFKYLQVDAYVRYWEDAEINGESDESGSNVPLKSGSSWRPLINLESGVILSWPKGVVASFYFKVCDAGDYSLLNESHEIVATHNNYYVPDGLLCYGECGYGDYIIMSVDENGKIENYRKPNLTEEHWDLQEK